MPRRIAKWMIKVALRWLRFRLARVDVAGQRRLALRGDRLLGAGAPESSGPPVALAACTAAWIDVPGAAPDRVILFMHGGAFMSETPKLHARLLAHFCRGAQARGLMVSYRLAPEHPFPAAVEDCLAAYRYLLDCGFLPRCGARLYRCVRP